MSAARIQCCGPETACPVCGANDAPCTWRPNANEYTCFGSANSKSNGKFRELRETLSGGRVYRLRHGHAEAEHPTKPVIIRAHEVQIEPVEWIWTNRLERGAFNILAGKQGLGKGVLTCALAASVTQGSAWPDELNQSRRPGAAVFLAAEDNVSRTIVPRLRAAGADLSRVAILKQVVVDDRRRRFNLQMDLPALEETLDELAPVELLIIDPLNSYLGKADTNVNEDVRCVLDPLVELAERRNISILGLKHPNKPSKGGGRTDAIYRVAGSSAFTEVARCVHLFAPHPDDQGTLVFAPLKISNGPKPEALPCTIQTVDGLPVAVWGGEPLHVDADELLQAQTGRQPTAVIRAAEWARTTLERTGGEMPRVTLFQEAQAANIAEDTLYKALKRLGATSCRPEGERNPGWVWRLPELARSHAE